MTGSPFARVLPLSDLAVGELRCVTVGGQEVVIGRTRDGVHAVGAICTHAHARMDEGRLRGHRLGCPLHGASFDLRTGAVLGGPAARPLPCYPCRVVDGYVEVRVSTGDPEPAT